MSKQERLQQLRESYQRVNEGESPTRTPRLQTHDVQESLTLMESFGEYVRDEKTASESLTSDEQ
jgi:hypothetical protein